MYFSTLKLEGYLQYRSRTEITHFKKLKLNVPFFLIVNATIEITISGKIRIVDCRTGIDGISIQPFLRAARTHVGFHLIFTLWFQKAK